MTWKADRPHQQARAPMFAFEAQQTLCHLVTEISAYMCPAHQLQRRFDPSPSIGLFAFALHFEAASFLSGFDKGFVTVCL